MNKIKKIIAYKVPYMNAFQVGDEYYCYLDLFIHFAPYRQYNTWLKQKYPCDYMCNWIEKHFDFKEKK